MCFLGPGDMCMCVSMCQLVLSVLVLLCREYYSDLAESHILLISFCPCLSVSLSVRRRAGVALLEACVSCAGRRFAVSCLPLCPAPLSAKLTVLLRLQARMYSILSLLGQRGSWCICRTERATIQIYTVPPPDNASSEC